jgi:hypothetical protein
VRGSFVLFSLVACSAASHAEPIRLSRADFATSTMAKVGSDSRWVGTPQTVAVGENFYTYTENQVTTKIVTDQDLAISTSNGEVSLPKGTVLAEDFGIDFIDLARKHGITATKVFNKGGKFVKRAALIDNDGDDRFESIESTNIGAKNFPLKTPLPYHFVANQIDSSVPPSFSWSLVYLGTAGGVLKIGYREFSSDLARPAFNNDLSFPSEIGKRSTFKFKNLSLTATPANDGTMLITVEHR